MPDPAAYPLTTLVFLIFSALAYGDLRTSHRGGPPLLSWFAGLLLVMLGVRLFVASLDHPDRFDGMLLLGVMFLIAFTVLKALIEGAARDPTV